MALIFANATLEPLWVAYMFWSPDTCRGEGGDWQAIGWFSVPPMRREPPKPGHGKQGNLAPRPIMTTVYGNSLSDVNNRYWCFYAQNASGSRVWGGPPPRTSQTPRSIIATVWAGPTGTLSASVCSMSATQTAPSLR